MAVVSCARCSRLLFRPDGARSRSWQCPKCGPTVVNEATDPISPELAALLEAEYLNSLFESAEVKPIGSAATVESPDGRFLADPHRWDWAGRLIILWVAVTVLLLVVAYLTPLQDRDFYIVSATVSGIGLIGTCVVLAVMGAFTHSARQRTRDAIVQHRDTITEHAFSDTGLTSGDRNDKEPDGAPRGEAIRLEPERTEQRSVRKKPD